MRSLLKPNEKVALYAISIDSTDKSKQVADNIAKDGKGPLNFPILSDRNHQVIDAFGIRNSQFDGQEFEGVPHPYVYIIDKHGRISWAKVENSYKDRPTNQELRTVLDSLLP